MMWIFFGFICMIITETVESDAVVRLLNGQNPLEGELQILEDGIWSYVCYNNFDFQSTRVVCRMLINNTYREYHYKASPYKDCVYNVTCSGNEKSIDECINDVTYARCSLHEIVAVRCGEDKMISKSLSPPGTAVRLFDGYNQNEGKVEVLVNGTWRSVANTNNSWGNKEANVICRMLGYSTNNVTGFHSPTLTQVLCAGDEASIGLCSINKGNYCEGDYNVFAHCGCSSFLDFYCRRRDDLCDTSLGTCQSDCSTGHYISGFSCEPCSTGTFQRGINQTRCKFCPFGAYQNLTGQTSCKTCPVGKYINKIGQVSCNACPPGTYQDETGQISCKDCPAGTYQNMAEQATCIACEPGTYQNSSGKTACIPCAGGKITLGTGSINQSECYKSQRDDPCPQANFNILIIGATLLAGVIIFDVISCALFLLRKGWDSGEANNTKIEIDLPTLKENRFGCDTASSRGPNLQVNKREHTNATRHDLTDREYETLHSYSNAQDAYDGIIID